MPEMFLKTNTICNSLSVQDIHMEEPAMQYCKFFWRHCCFFNSIYRLCPLREYKKGFYQIQPVFSENYFSILVVKLSRLSKVWDEDKCLKQTSLRIIFLDMNFHNQTVRLLHFNQIMSTSKILQNLGIVKPHTIKLNSWETGQTSTCFHRKVLNCS